MPAQDAFLAGLEADLRALSQEARRSDSLAGQLTGWLSGAEHPAIKESAERAMLKLRSAVDQGQGLEAIKGNKVMCMQNSMMSLIKFVHPTPCQPASVHANSHSVPSRLLVTTATILLVDSHSLLSH